MDTPDNVVTVPPCFARDFQVAHRTETLLRLPQMERSSLTFEVIQSFSIQPFLKVSFPLRIIRIGLVSDLNMPLDGCLGRKMEENLMFAERRQRDLKAALE